MDGDLLRDLKALAHVGRLRVLGRLANGPASLDALAEELRIPRPALSRDLGHLEVAGLVASTAAGWSLRPEGVNAIGRRLAELEAVESGRMTTRDGAGHPAVELLTAAGLDLDADDVKVLRAFVLDGRLVGIPAHERKRAVVLRWTLETCFADDREYPEREVNERLATLHEDTASLRRYLVDAGLMERRAGIYRRRLLRAVRPGV